MNNKQWHQNGMPIMMIDAETDGLYGSVLSIAAMVVDGKNQVTETFYKEIDLKKCEIKNLWVQKNLISIMTQKDILDSEEILLEKFWQFWEKYYTNVYGIADVAYPVEDRLTLSPYRGIQHNALNDVKRSVSIWCQRIKPQLKKAQYK